jgi:hypothetical protein
MTPSRIPCRSGALAPVSDLRIPKARVEVEKKVKVEVEAEAESHLVLGRLVLGHAKRRQAKCR